MDVEWGRAGDWGIPGFLGFISRYQCQTLSFDNPGTPWLGKSPACSPKDENQRTLFL